MTDKIDKWTGDIQSSFRGIVSECIARGDGTVVPYDGGYPLPDVPFLFDDKYPPRALTCAHCQANQKTCCGVCVFESRACVTVWKYAKGINTISLGKLQAALDNDEVVHNFTPCELFTRIRGRTLWFIGDKHSTQFYYSTECFMREFGSSFERKSPLKTGSDKEAIKGLSPIKIDPICMELALGSRICNIWVHTAEHVEKNVMPVLLDNIPGIEGDVIVWSVGMSYIGRTSKDEFKKELDSFQSYREKSIKQGNKWPRMIWADVPPKHVADGSDALACKAKDPDLDVGASMNAQAKPYLNGISDAHLQTYDVTLGMVEAHPPSDCSLWCSPSAYHAWVYLLNRVMKREGIGNTAIVQHQDIIRNSNEKHD